MATRSQIFYSHVLGSVFLFGLGSWYIATQEAEFRFGGRHDGTGSRRGIFVNAKGPDAIAIGSVFVGLGLVNLALGMRSGRRIPVFWAGAVVLGLCLLYGLGLAALDIYETVTGSDP